MTADPAAKRALELRAFDRQAKLAFLECALARRFDWLQTAHGPPAAAGAPAMPILDYTGFVECLLLCSQLRYEALGPKFERSARASAFLSALFGKADVEAQVRALGETVGLGADAPRDVRAMRGSQASYASIERQLSRTTLPEPEHWPSRAQVGEGRQGRLGKAEPQRALDGATGPRGLRVGRPPPSARAV